MRRRLLLPLVAGALALALVGVNAASAIGVSSVSIVDTPRPQEKWGYAPLTRKIPTGTWVTWSNAGTEAHTVTAEDGSFDSGELDPSEGFSWFFDQPGTYDYVCALHPWMQGRIIVGDGGSAAPAPAPAPADDTSD